MVLELLGSLFATAKTALKTRRDLALEKLALRQQLAVFKRGRPRPRLNQGDQLFWVWLSRTWKDWTEALIIVKPETVIRWHSKGFKWFWAVLFVSATWQFMYSTSNIRSEVSVAWT